jgi:hypothetical protein
MRLEISALLFGSLNGKQQSAPREWSRKLQTRIVDLFNRLQMHMGAARSSERTLTAPRAGRGRRAPARCRTRWYMRAVLSFFLTTFSYIWRISIGQQLTVQNDSTALVYPQALQLEDGRTRMGDYQLGKEEVLSGALTHTLSHSLTLSLSHSLRLSRAHALSLSVSHSRSARRRPVHPNPLGLWRPLTVFA